MTTRTNLCSINLVYFRSNIFDISKYFLHFILKFLRKNSNIFKQFFEISKFYLSTFYLKVDDKFRYIPLIYLALVSMRVNIVKYLNTTFKVSKKNMSILMEKSLECSRLFYESFKEFNGIIDSLISFHQVETYDRTFTRLS